MYIYIYVCVELRVGVYSKTLQRLFGVTIYKRELSLLWVFEAGWAPQQGPFRPIMGPIWADYGAHLG